jgi:hypothetical protein
MGFEGMVALYPGIRTHDVDTHGSPELDILLKGTKII